MDAFFAAVEERDHAHFRGRPLVVGADPEEGHGRGVVSTANYLARKYGIRSALPISKAWKLAEAARKRGEPEVIFMAGNYHKYAEVSQRVFDIVRTYAPITEEASVDEIYFDVSFTGSYEKAEALCRRIKKEIKKKEKLTCSVGIGPNKLIAKIASDRQKPDGLTVVLEDEVESFLDPLPVRTLPGVGPKAEETLKRYSVRIVEDLRRFSQEELMKLFGKWGGELYEKVRGRSNSPISEAHEIKSIGEQETFRQDSRDWGLVSKKMAELCEEVQGRFAQSGFSTFKTIVVTVRFADFETITRTHTLAAMPENLCAFHFETIKILLPFFDARENPGRKAIRLIGVRVEKFT
jgi:DNA polymerase IV (archaeal DinB-like DNA polymerase)